MFLYSSHVYYQIESSHLTLCYLHYKTKPLQILTDNIHTHSVDSQGDHFPVFREFSNFPSSYLAISDISNIQQFYHFCTKHWHAFTSA